MLQEIQCTQQKLKFTSAKLVGFYFMINLRGGKYFSGNVLEMKENGKRRCRFCNRAEHDYTMGSLEKDSMNKANVVSNNDTSSSDNVSGEEENKDKSDMNNVENVDKSGKSANEKSHTSPKTSNKEIPVLLSNGRKNSKYFKSMIGLSSTELQKRDTSIVAFRNAISVPINIIYSQTIWVAKYCQTPH